MSENRTQLIYIMAVLAAAVLIAFILVASGKKPERTEHVSPGPLVEVLSVHRENVPIVIRGQGTVRARTSIQVVPQVSGRIVRVHPEFVNGGFFRQDEPLIVIDPTDYELALHRAEADLAAASVGLETEQAQSEIAREEWNKLHPDREPDSDLVLRIPQVKKARADLQAARANLETARLNLERTRVTLPFNGRITEKSVDIGQFVTAGQPAAVVYGTDSVEIPVPLEDSELAWFDIPFNGKRGKGSPARVKVPFAGSEESWDGRVVRMEGEVDPVTRMVHVVVEVKHPFSEKDHSVPLLPGTFADIDILGKTLEKAIAVPRHALHGDSTVWKVTDGTLRVTPVRVARKDHDYAYLVEGLDEGDLVVASSLDAITDGMNVRYRPEEKPPSSTGPEERIP